MKEEKKNMNKRSETFLKDFFLMKQNEMTIIYFFSFPGIFCDVLKEKEIQHMIQVFYFFKVVT